MGRLSGMGAVYLVSAMMMISLLHWKGLPSESTQISFLRFDGQERTLLTLAGVWAAIAFRKWLVSGEKVTLRLIIGRLIIGASLSMAAAAALVMVPNVPPVALIGLGAAS